METPFSQGQIVCILGASAEDKGTGKAKKITITLDKHNLPDEDIERMVKEAQVYAEEAKEGQRMGKCSQWV